MSYYIKDYTINKIVYKNNVNEVVNYLEELCKKVHKKTRKNYMDDMANLGYGFDDEQGVYFTELMMEKFDVGVLRKDGRHVRSNIHEHARNLKYRKEMGD